MEALNPIEKKIEQAKTQVSYYERALGHDIDELRHWWQSKSQMLERIRRFFTDVLLKRRTLVIIGAAVVGFLIIRALLPGRRRRHHAMADGAAVVVQQEPARPSFLGGLLRSALKAFVLHYARKLLMQYLDQQMQPQAAPSSKSSTAA